MYDFYTLYTNLKHDEIKIGLREVVKIAFKHSKYNLIAVYDKSFAWVKNYEKIRFILMRIC